MFWRLIEAITGKKRIKTPCLRNVGRLVVEFVGENGTVLMTKTYTGGWQAHMSRDFCTLFHFMYTARETMEDDIQSMNEKGFFHT